MVHVSGFTNMGFTINKAVSGKLKKKAPHVQRMFECVTPNNSKFWEITITDNAEYGDTSVFTRYGKIGTAGVEKEVWTDDLGACNLWANKKIKEKLDKGYVEVDASGVVSVAAPFLISKADLKMLKADVKNYAKELFALAVQDYGATAPEVIVTMIVQGEVIQETVSK